MITRGVAEGLLAIVDSEPDRVLAESLEVVAAAEAAGDRAGACIALRARSLALAYSESLSEAVDTIERALGMGAGEGDGVVGGLEMTAGALYVWAGRTSEGLRMLERAATRADVGARADVQRGAVLYRLGRHREAIEALEHASGVLDAEDREWWSRLETNYGIALAAVGRIDEALAAVRRSIHLDESDHRDHGAAIGVHNLGWISALAGDLPTAFDHFEDATKRAKTLGIPMAERWRDRAEALLVAGIYNESVAAAGAAVRSLERSGNRAGATEARLKRAEALLAAGNTVEARREAAQAAAEFAGQDRPGWSAYARSLVLASSDSDVDDLTDQLLSLVGPLMRYGFASAADQARLSAVRSSIAQGDQVRAGTLLGEIRVRSLRPHLGPQYWLARAELARAMGDAPAAMRSARAGLDQVEGHRAALGSSEARAQLSRNVDTLVRLGVELTAAAKRPRRLFDWVERGRAGSLRLPRVLPPPDPESAALMAELRSLEHLIELSPIGDEHTRALRRRARVEGDLKARTRALRGTAGRMAPLRARDVIGRLGEDEGILTIVEAGDELRGLVLHRGRVREMSMGSASSALRSSGEALAKLALLAGRPTEARAAEVRSALGRLDLPLSVRLPDSVESVLLVPPPELAAVPWSLLPSLCGRVVSQAPSVTSGISAVPETRALRRIASVAGPGLVHADAEVALVAGHYPLRRVLSSSDAGTEEVLAALDWADVGHLACHGSFRHDSPMFSWFGLAGGRVFVHELERLASPPAVLVLSACDLGASAPVSAGESLGPVTALLASGVTTVIASPVLVPDHVAVAEVLSGFHQRLRAGTRPARALTAAKALIDDHEPLSLAVGALQAHGHG